MKTMLSKLTSVLLCLAMLLTMCSFAMAEAGTYTGVGDSEIGGKGAIEVSVTVDENGVVTDIQVTKNGDTAGIADAAVEAMPGRIMAAQSANVDGVSGATFSSAARTSSCAGCRHGGGSGHGKVVYLCGDRSGEGGRRHL